MTQETQQDVQARLRETRTLKENILLQPARQEAIKLVMKAAKPDGVHVSDEGGAFFVNPEGLVSWTTSKGVQKRPIEEMPSVNLLFWVHSAAEQLVKREQSLEVAPDPTGLGL